MNVIGIRLHQNLACLLLAGCMLVPAIGAQPRSSARADEWAGMTEYDGLDRAEDGVEGQSAFRLAASDRTVECSGCNSSSCSACNAFGSGPLDTLSLFLGLEGSKQPQDFGVNAHFGGRFAANWGVPVLRDAGLGAQIGTSINYTDNAVQVLERVAGVTERTQVFTTVGLFQRSPQGLVWGIGYDFLYQDYYDEFNLGQWRGQLGLRMNPCNEAGVRVSLSGYGDDGALDGIPLRLEPITQGSLYWRRWWQTGTQTTAWVGVAEGHSEANLALGDLPPTDERLLFGADVHAPLNDWLAIWGEANFITPADTGTVDAYLGVAYYPGGGAFAAFRRNFFPVLPLANSPSFSVDLTR